MRWPLVWRSTLEHEQARRRRAAKLATDQIARVDEAVRIGTEGATRNVALAGELARTRRALRLAVRSNAKLRAQLAKAKKSSAPAAVAGLPDMVQAAVLIRGNGDAQLTAHLAAEANKLLVIARGRGQRDDDAAAYAAEQILTGESIDAFN